MNRLLPIEGLRAYLAIWVLINHVIFFSSSALHDPLAAGRWWTAFSIFESGPLAVQVFMIISGFVITLLLAKRRESYPQFITRRFFRLYPLYILLLAVALSAHSWHWQAFLSSRDHMDSDDIDYYSSIMQATHDNWWPSLTLHLAMLHGLPPGDFLDQLTAYSFIIAAWSISVEWEFYLLAPLIHYLLGASALAPRVVGWGGALLIYLLARHYHYFTPNFLVFMPFFLIGVASSYAYKACPPLPPDTVFPPALGLALFAYIQFGRQEAFIPLLIWVPFLALLCEPANSVSARFFSSFFNNGPAQFLGACSYGIYLSHEFVILLAQSALLAIAPQLGHVAYFFALLALTLAGTFLLAGALHYLVELPGMDLGRKLAAKIPGRHLVPVVDGKGLKT